jgi:transcriptional regulator with XRE-family HTH domain
MELRTARETAGLTQRDVAAEMDWSLSKLIRIESGAVNIATSDLRALLDHYGVNDTERVRGLTMVAKAARERSDWAAYSDVASPEFIAYLEFESSASAIRSFEPVFVPGLLQTEEYAREAIAGLAPDLVDLAEARVELRMARQELLRQDDRPELFFILDEAVIRRVVGSPEITRKQLEFLLEAAALDRVTVLVVPYCAGVYPLLRLRLSSVLLEFPDVTDGNVLFLEQPSGDMLIREEQSDSERLERPAAYLEAFWQAEDRALDYALPDLIGRALEALDGQ